jgi:riboflavin biosynthesis pyrimidine reductase
MGLLRASADAVMVGSGTLHQTTPEHPFVADHVCPEARDLYAHYRSGALKRTAPPLQVVVSGSGRMDLTRAIFRTPGIRTLIVTTQGGSDLLAASGVRSLISTEVRTLEGPIVAPASILELLRAEFCVSLLLHEGGPTLFGKFVANGCVDELFLTIAPHVAGRNRQPLRPGFIAGVEFLPEAAPWLDIVSVKKRGNYLIQRSQLQPVRKAHERPSGGVGHATKAVGRPPATFSRARPLSYFAQTINSASARVMSAKVRIDAAPERRSALGKSKPEAEISSW